MKPSDYVNSPHWRHTWWRLTGGYLPVIYAAMKEEERTIIDQWYEDTEKRDTIGEMSVPLASLMTAFINGSNVRRVVQIGHYAGYSTLVFGFCLKSMGAKRSLWTLDIDAEMTEYTRQWISKAGLRDYVHAEVGDSKDPRSVERCKKYLGGEPAIILIDASHEYAQTVVELDLWYSALASKGLILLHDTSEFARKFDSTSQGGVKRAFDEWTARNCKQNSSININPNDNSPAYLDLCGAGIIHKP